MNIPPLFHRTIIRYDNLYYILHMPIVVLIITKNILHFLSRLRKNCLLLCVSNICVQIKSLQLLL